MWIQRVSSRDLRRLVQEGREAQWQRLLPPALPAAGLSHAQAVHRRLHDYEDRQFLKACTADGYR